MLKYLTDSVLKEVAMKAQETAIKWAAAAALVALLGLSAFVIVHGWMGGHFDSFDTLRNYIVSFGMWGPVVLALIQMLQVVLPVLPGFLGSIVGAALFGWLEGFLVNYIGICLGSITAYWLAKRYGMQLVAKMVPMEKYGNWIDRINRSKSYTVFLLACIVLPLVPDDFLCYFSGLMDMKPKKFISIILFGKIWCLLFYSIFFAYFI